MAKMTTVQKLAQAQAMVAKYTAELTAERIRNNIQEGDAITFQFGRGDTRKEMTGSVLGVKDDANGRWIAVSAGEGFEMQTYRIRAADILTNAAADARGSDAPAEVAPDVDVAPSNAPVDPLEAE